MNVDVIAGYVITGVVVLSICYMFFYESVKKDDKKPQANDKYSALYKIAEMIVANFDPNKLPAKQITDQALPKVQEQAQKDNIHVTDDVAKGAIKQVINSDDTKAKDGYKVNFDTTDLQKSIENVLSKIPNEKGDK